MKVRVRIAPSPTGDAHLGTAYMALFNLIFARHFGGDFILRIEDTDQSRSRLVHEETLIEALHWLGIEWDEGPDIGGPFAPYRQSERTEIYQYHCQKLIDEGKAYKCFATPEELAQMRKEGNNYDRRYRNLTPQEISLRENAGDPYVIRLKTPLAGSSIFEDGLRGQIIHPWADIDDQILLKSDRFPTYHLANVVDDHLMGITHVIRGDEWISSTPKHLLLYKYFGWNPPTYMHMPLLLGKDGRKLSKRRDPTSIFYYKESGYIREALVNFLTLMGYRMADDREIYSLKELIEQFDPKRIGTSAAFFDIRKLDWLNQHYIINNVPESQLWNQIRAWGFNDHFMDKLMPLCRMRMKTWGDFIDLSSFLFTNNLSYTDLLFTMPGLERNHVRMIFQTFLWDLEKYENWDCLSIEKSSKEIASLFDLNHKKIIIPLLYGALMGKRQGLSLYGSFELLGKNRSRVRLLNAIQFLGGVSKEESELLSKCWKSGNCKNLIAAADLLEVPSPDQK